MVKEFEDDLNTAGQERARELLDAESREAARVAAERASEQSLLRDAVAEIQRKYNLVQPAIPEIEGLMRILAKKTWGEKSSPLQKGENFRYNSRPTPNYSPSVVTGTLAELGIGTDLPATRNILNGPYPWNSRVLEGILGLGAWGTPDVNHVSYDTGLFSLSISLPSTEHDISFSVNDAYEDSTPKRHAFSVDNIRARLVEAYRNGPHVRGVPLYSPGKIYFGPM